MVSSRCDKGIQQRPFPCWRCLTVLGCHLLKHFASCLKTQRLFHAPLLWKRAAGDLFVEATDYSPCPPYEKSSFFSLTSALLFSCFRADERRCGLGGETSTESEEKRCLKRRKEDFREAMRMVLLANSKIKRVLSESSQYFERENRIRQQYLSEVLPYRLYKPFYLPIIVFGVRYYSRAILQYGPSCHRGNEQINIMSNGTNLL